MENTYTLSEKNMSQVSHKTAQSTSWFGRLSQQLTPSYFGLIAFTIAVASCLGGIAAMFVLQKHSPIWELGFVMFAAMANLVAAIGQTPVKWVLGTFIFSCLVSAGFILMNI